MNSDLLELLAAFEKNKVKYLIIGGYAVSYHAEPRYTKDVDLWIDTSAQNAKLVHKTLIQFGAPLHGTAAQDFMNKDSFFSFGVAPNCIDILMGPPGLDFHHAWVNRKIEYIDGISLYYISRQDLITLKKAAGREIDLRDIKALQDSAPENQ